MLSKRTVLVLGAGASKPFGFPTDIELSEKIIEQCQPDWPAFLALKDHLGYGPQEIEKFTNAFFFSGKNSIDAFLEHRTEYLELGKAAIAATIIPYEVPEKLFAFRKSWLRYLYGRLNAAFDQFQQHQLSIITFNYDRTVEHFFVTALMNTYNKSEKECAAILSKVQIIHLHGRLGYMPWHTQINRSRKFSSEIGDGELQVAQSNIHIIHEIEPDFQRAKKLLREAEQICFLGFEYNEINMQRLDISSLQKGKAKGTALGLTTRERDDIAKRYGHRITLFDTDCDNFVREYVDWE